MKQLLLTLLFALLPFKLLAGGEQDFASRFMSLYASGTSLKCSTVSPLMMERMMKLPSAREDEEMKQILEKLKSIRLLSHSKPSEADTLLRKAHQLAERNAKRYRPWAINGGKSIYVRKRNSLIVEVVLVMQRGGYFTLVDLTGNLDEKLMQRLIHI